MPTATVSPAAVSPVVAAAALAAIDGILADLFARLGDRQDQLLPVLHGLQEGAGYIPPERVPEIARHFNLSLAEVHGVITFYHYFRSEPPPRCVIQVCRAEACQSMGADQLLEHAQAALGCGLHGHTADGAFGLEPVYCLGQCASAPALTINEAVFARVSPARFDALIAGVLADDARTSAMQASSVEVTV
ncbi:NAD(P)H-dependent oxidoreductase subunit E [Pseudoduganella lutea]|uniref:Formate dehydrogenase n=1 Tax=Pseudoduganella lutea TaxID=321985 RepID=A0A4P6KVW7_9BURK|nr:NAD(P)H-dependent oxidoreductase subunit E [Pseudoduganella lutea]QBE63291.1 formate dehydrogenase [Pseudoduganella lutea]